MKFESSHPHQSCPIILHAGHKWRREGTRNTSTGKEVGNEEDDVGVSVGFLAAGMSKQMTVVTRCVNVKCVILLFHACSIK
jgi:hypothetical protein